MIGASKTIIPSKRTPPRDVTAQAIHYGDDVSKTLFENRNICARRVR